MKKDVLAYALGVDPGIGSVNAKGTVTSRPGAVAIIRCAGKSELIDVLDIPRDSTQRTVTGKYDIDRFSEFGRHISSGILADALAFAERSHEKIRVAMAVEKQITIPHQGLVSQAHNFYGWAMLTACLYHSLKPCCDVTILNVAAKEWQKAFFGMVYTTGKSRSVEVCQRLFPARSWETKRKSGLHNRADAALIAQYSANALRAGAV